GAAYCLADAAAYRFANDDTDGHSDRFANANCLANTHADADPNANADADSHVGANAYTQADAYTQTDAHADADCYTHANTDSYAYARGMHHRLLEDAHGCLGELLARSDVGQRVRDSAIAINAFRGYVANRAWISGWA
ncbi:MAG: hypothetical protein AAB092_06640, partial [Chloroflexota bacterium]